MLPEPHAFLKAIAADPDDDTPRLVFADWLQEHGEEEYAEFIRVACRFAGTDLTDPDYPFVAQRIWELQHTRPGHPDWHAPIHELTEAHGTNRGIPELALLSRFQDDGVRERLRMIIANTPIRQVHFSADEGVIVGDLLDMPEFAELRGIGLISNREDVREELDRLAGRGPFPHLCKLTLGFGACEDPDIEAFTRWPGLATLNELDLEFGSIDADHLTELLASPLLRSLRTLRLSGQIHGRVSVLDRPSGNLSDLCRLDLSGAEEPFEDWIAVLSRNGPSPVTAFESPIGGPSGDEIVEHLAWTGWQLRELRARSTPFSTTAVGRLAAMPHLSDLHTLGLPRCRIDDGGAAALARSTVFHRLRWLDLTDNWFEEHGLREILTGPACAGLWHLDVEHPDGKTWIPHADLATTLRSDSVPPLRSLNLSGRHIDGDGAEALGACERLADLRTLCLMRCGLTSADLRRIVDSRVMDNVGHLDVRWNSISDVTWLAEADVLPRLRVADLDHNPLDEPSQRALGDRFSVENP